MLDRTNPTDPPFIVPRNDDEDESDRAGAWTATNAVDRELEAAIEYKIAVSGVSGAATVLEMLDLALRRYRA